MSQTVFKAPFNSADTSITGGQIPTGHVIRLFKGFQKYLDPTETPLTNAIGNGGTVNQRKVEWGQEYLGPHQVTLGGAVADGSTTTITLAADQVAKITLTDLIQLEEEIMWVTAIASATTLTVVRGMSGSTAAAHTLNDTAGVPRVIEVLTTAAQDNADTPMTFTTLGTTAYNLPQLIDQGIQVSQREEHTPNYEEEGASRYDIRLKKVMKIVAIKYEKLLFRGRRAVESSMTIGSGTPSTMGGLDYFTPNLIPLAGAPLTEAVLMTLTRNAWDRVGAENVPTKLFVGSFLFTVLSSMWNTDRYATISDKKMNLVWKEVETAFGTIQFQLSRYVAPGDAYFMDPSDPKHHPYAGGEWAEVMLPANGPYKKGRFTGDRTSSWRGELKRWKITGASVTTADYPFL